MNSLLGSISLNGLPNGYVCGKKVVRCPRGIGPTVWGGCSQALVLGAKVLTSLGFQALFLAHFIVLQVIVPQHGCLSCVFPGRQVHCGLFFFFLLSSSVMLPLKNLLLLCDLIHGPAVEHDLLEVDAVFWEWWCRMTVSAVSLCLRCLEGLWSQGTAVFRGQGLDHAGGGWRR